MAQSTSGTEIMHRFKVDSLKAASLTDFAPGLYHGFTSMIAPTGAEPFERSLRCYLGAGGIQDFHIDRLSQDHTSEIMFVTGERVVPFRSTPGRGHREEGTGQVADLLRRGDGMVMEPAPGRLVVIHSADCVPILAVNRHLSQIAALHAGWRGVAGGILSNLLKEWSRRGGRLDGVRLAFGPSIRSCCYQVRDDCLSRFPRDLLAGAVSNSDGKTFLELTTVLLNQARILGVEEGQMEVLPVCTSCYDPPGDSARFASYRRDLGLVTAAKARNASFIGMHHGDPQSSPF